MSTYASPDIALSSQIENVILELEEKIANRADDGEIMALTDEIENRIEDLFLLDPDGADFYQHAFEDVLSDHMNASEHAVNDALNLVGLGR